MDVQNKYKLAIKGGTKTVTITAKDGWRYIQEEEIELVIKMLKEEKITMVPDVVRECEKDYANYFGTKYALSQNNATSCLIAAFFAVGVGPGDEVLVPAYTWHATISPIVLNNGIPVFCEIDPKTLTIDPEDIRRKISRNTKAITVVHIWGNVAKMDEIMDIAREHHLPVIEDCSHAHGAEYDGKKVGSIGDIGVFSLQGSKPITGGEAGIIVTNNTDYYERILLCGHYGRLEKDLVTDKYRDIGRGPGIGYKFRAHPLAMGIAKIQLTRLDKINKKRTATVAYLDKELSKLKGIEPVSAYPLAKRGGFYEYRLIYHPEQLDNLPPDKLIKALKAEGVPVNTCRYPLWHTHPLYQGYDIHGKGCPFHCPQVKKFIPPKLGDLPVTESIHHNLLALPVYTEPPPGLLKQFVESFRKVIENITELKDITK